MKRVVGLTATNALASEFEITSYRDGVMKYLQFKDGKMIADKESAVKSKSKHGLTVAFSPSPIYLGTDCVLEPSELDDWLTKLSFFMPEIMKIKFEVRSDDETKTFTKYYQNKTGIGGFLSELSPESDLLKTPVVLLGNTTIMEENIPIKDEKTGEVNLTDVERSIDLQVAINFNPNNPEETTKFSFCNTIETIEHGEHLSAVLDGIVNYFRKKYKEENPKASTEITTNDILNGLSVVVNMDTDYSTGLFTSQTKHKMDNRVFSKPVKKLTTDALDVYFKTPENKKTLSKILGFIKDNIKARMAATKVRKTTKKNNMTFMDTTLIANYAAPNLIGKRDDLPFEIYIVEGDSAGGNAINGRFDNDIQGCMGLIGKPDNAWDWGMDYFKGHGTTLKKLFDDILQCGYGPNFKLENCVYKKILLMPDADVDGDHITTIVVGDIYKHARPLIEHGMVYRVITPLYRINDKIREKAKNKYSKDFYLYSKDEFFEMFEQQTSKEFKIKFDLNDKEYVSRANMKRFLQTNRDYFQWLDTMSKHYKLHMDILEYMAKHYKTFRNNIQERFPEMSYDKKGESISGVYDGEYYTVILDSIFMNSLSYLTKVIEEGNAGVYKYHAFKYIKSRKEDDYLGYLTIGQIMTLCQVYEPTIGSRYKGLGELTIEEMHNLMMDPNNRILVRFTIKDAERLSEALDDLLSENKADVRKKLIQESSITVDDIDN